MSADLRETGAFNGVAAAIAEREDKEHEPWPKRKLLDACDEPQALPVQLVPEPLRDWVSDVSERMVVPIGFVAVPMVVALGSVLGSAIGVKPKRFDDWYEHANLWGALVANPGMLKTPAQAEALRPLHALAKSARESYCTDKSQYDTDADNIRIEIEQLEGELKKTLRDAHAAHAANRPGIEQKLNEKRRLLAEEPRERLYVVHDSTVEKLAILLRDNPRGVLQERDELSGWLSAMEKQGREGDRAFYLESWSGKQSFSTHRIGRGDVHVDRMCLSVLGTIQPGPLRELVAESERGGGGADGLLQRFQVLSVSSVCLPWRNVDRVPDIAARDRVSAVFRRFDELDPTSIASEQGPVPLVRFDRHAQAVFDEWREDLEKRVRDNSEPPTFRAFLAKMRKTVPALALIFHVCEFVESGDVTPIGEKSVVAACAWSEIIASHARWIYEPRRSSDARELAKHLESGKIVDGATTRSLQNRGLAGTDTRERLGVALGQLEAAGWVRLVETTPGQRGGRSSEILRIHPELRRDA